MQEFLATQQSSSIEKLQDVLSPSIRLQNVRDKFKKPRDRRGQTAKKGLMEEFSNSEIRESEREKGDAVPEAEPSTESEANPTPEEAVEMDVDTRSEDNQVRTEERELQTPEEAREIPNDVRKEVGEHVVQSEERGGEVENMEVVDEAPDQPRAGANASSSTVEPEENEANSSKTRLMAAPRLPAQTASNRAISTPNKNRSVLADNITFLERSHELSAIPVLTPPTAPRSKATRRLTQANAESPR
jgi:hypothetical protein